jgi:hypothetical protein
MKNTATLPLAFVALAVSQGHAMIDGQARTAIATDGEAIVILPLPEPFENSGRLVIERAVSDYTIVPTDPEPTEGMYDLSPLDAIPSAYRIAINPAKLAAIAAALDSEDLVILELPASPAEGPLRIMPGNCEPGTGYLMPQPMPAGGGEEGLLGEIRPGGKLPEIQTAKRSKPAAESKPLPPPVVTASAERKTLEITFGGVPAKEIREALKDPALAFRYSGRGTRRGVPANAWYGPDNPFTREQIQKLLGVQIQQAAAA